MHNDWNDNEKSFSDSGFDFDSRESDSLMNDNEIDSDFDSHENDSYLNDEFVRAFLQADSPVFAESDADPEPESPITEADVDTADDDFASLVESFTEDDISEPESEFETADGNFASLLESFTEDGISEPESEFETADNDFSQLLEAFSEEYISDPESFADITLPEWERTDVSASELQESLYSLDYQAEPKAEAAELEYNRRGVQHRRYSRSVVARRKRKSRRIRFLKTMCIVLVCALLSAASAYLVMEFRIHRGDFTPPINQVVIGGRVPESIAEEIPPPVTPTIATSRTPMAPEDLYLMAVDQVVGIRTMFPQNHIGSFTDAAAASGSGFIISYDGYILTNFHVIELGYQNRLPIFVDLYDGRSYRADIVGFDSASDVALIKIEAENLSAATIGDSDATRVGQTVYAIGNPFGDLIYTMTDGIVSALDRVVTIERQIINTFQFSAAVNTGNSGGPIFNIYGEVIGIVTAKVARQGVEGIGFAIPINDAIDIAVKLIEVGFLPGRALIGITIQTVSGEDAEQHGLVAGSRVVSVNPGSAAENAGMQAGDIIIGLGDAEVTGNDSLEVARSSFYAGDTTTITVWRDGEVLELTITFDENLNAGRPQR